MNVRPLELFARSNHPLVSTFIQGLCLIPLSMTVKRQATAPPSDGNEGAVDNASSILQTGTSSNVN
jgi:hypothetical protein